MGSSRFERESEDPQSPRMPGYPTTPCSTIISRHLIIKLRFCRRDLLEFSGFFLCRIFDNKGKDKGGGRYKNPDGVRDMEPVHEYRLIQICK